MKQFAIGCVVGLLGWGWTPAASAQYYRPPTSPFYRPPVSPYLNLARPGTPPGINYYGLVRPQIDVGTSLLQLQQAQLQGAGTVIDPNTGYPVTGHATRFGNYSHYFSNQGGAGARFTARTAASQPQVLGTGLGGFNAPLAAPPAGPRPPRAR